METESPKGLGPTNLSYDDQCDLVYGRLRRLVADNPEVLASADNLVYNGLDVQGLGLSGEQVSMVLEQLRGERQQTRDLQEAVEMGWGVIANASDWSDDTRKEWNGAAEHWRDHHYPALRRSLPAPKIDDAPAPPPAGPTSLNPEA
tara:strand:- start:40732 stop:41169 length:438 start_codon:yes stop_codon:yes gene_type:complete